MKKVFSLLTTLLICFGVSACNSDKECNCNEQENCPTNNQSNGSVTNDNPVPTVMYKHIDHKRVVYSAEDYTYTYEYTVAIANPTSDTINITLDKFSLQGTRHYVKTDDTSYNQSFGAAFNVYADTAKTQALTNALSVLPNTIICLYIKTAVLHKDIPAYGDIKSDELISLELKYDNNFIIFHSA